MVPTVSPKNATRTHVKIKTWIRDITDQLEPTASFWPALARDAKTPRIRAPRVDERADQSPILD